MYIGFITRVHTALLQTLLKIVRFNLLVSLVANGGRNVVTDRQTKNNSSVTEVFTEYFTERDDEADSDDDDFKERRMSGMRSVFV